MVSKHYHLGGNTQSNIRAMTDITIAKNEVKDIIFTLYETAPTAGSAPVISDISGATITFTVFDSPQALNEIYTATGTITDAINGKFSVPIMANASKRAATLYYSIWATYTGGNKVFWFDGKFTVNNKGIV